MRKATMTANDHINTLMGYLQPKLKGHQIDLVRGGMGLIATLARDELLDRQEIEAVLICVNSTIERYQKNADSFNGRYPALQSLMGRGIDNLEAIKTKLESHL
jgi:hypothetical protein